MSAAPDLVGRDEEIALALSHLLDDRTVVLVGRAGVGKSRLAEEIAARARGLGYHIVGITATPATATIPFAALAPLVDGRPPAGQDVARWIASAVTALTARTRPRKVLLTIDDVDHLDPGSAALVFEMKAIGQVKLLATERTTGRPPSRVVDAVYIPVTELSRAAVEEVAAAMLGGPVASSSVDALHAVTGGNPLSLAVTLNSGGFTSSAHGWQWSRGSARRVPVLDVIADQIASLDSDIKSVVELVALAEPIEQSIVLDLTSEPALVVATARAFVTRAPDRRRRALRLSHPLYGEAALAGIGEIRRAALLASLAEALGRTAMRRRTDAVRAVHWGWRTGSDLDPEVLSRAAGQTVLAWTTAVSEWLDGGAPAAPPPGDPDIAELLIRRAWARAPSARTGLMLTYWLWRRQRGNEALDVIDAAKRLVRKGDDAVWLDLVRARALASPLGRFDEAIGLLDLLVGDRRGTQMGLEAASVRLNLLLNAGRLDEARRHLPADQSAVNWVGLELFAGKPATARKHAEDGVRDALAQPHQMDAGVLLVAQALCLRWEGKLAEANALIEQLGLLVHAADTAAAAIVTALRASFELDAGRVASATRLLSEVVSIDLGQYGVYSEFLWGKLARGHALSGDIGRCRASVSEMERRRNPAFALFKAEGSLAMVWLDAASGRRPEAAQRALQLADECRDSGQFCYEAEALFDAARLGSQRTVHGRLATRVATLEGDYLPTIGAHVDALVGAGTRRGDALDEVADAWETMGHRLYGAEAAAAASLAHRGAGHERKAARSDEVRQRLAAACEGAVTPGLVVSTDASAGLTPRQADIVRLARDGLTARAIGERLNLSTRTVEGHLRMAIAKLGLNSKSDLVDRPHSLT